ncbi:nme/nm23 family member 8 [Holotrichia oblita]|uniref:Nme/nm23 family member 8 n=1 Tax=Holotrichia oblita TaxID=644536 RepID=A0ACB9TH41_HOLOL|nr:nme/nm23 family member 8 [Holotrichia oblita]
MKFFNADGTIRREKDNDEDFGWVWKNLLEDRGMKMVIYNFDGSVRSEEYYNENNDWEIVTDNEKEDRNQDDKTEAVNTIKWYQRTFSNIQEDTKTNLSNLLIHLDNKESHLILSIINNAILNFLPDTNLRKPTRIYTALRYSDINNDVTKTLRLKRLYRIFDIGFDLQLLQKRYLPLSDNKSAYEVNKYIEDYIEVVQDLRQILCWDVYSQSGGAEVDPGPKRVEIDKSKELYTDIDQTLLKLMAKKGTQVQLQAEISTEEDWEKLLEREGLIVVDVYSDWCGPCAAMSANLKKLKLEVGGDNLQLAMAKSDNINVLQRFREKSEPTWMFIANGKMINLMFGANAPKLTRLIIDELKKEEAIREGTRTRHEMDLMELAPEEQVRFEATEKERLESEEIERGARMKAKDERLHLIVDCILQAFPTLGVLVVFPYALDKITLLQEIWEPNGIKTGNIEKASFKQINIEDLLYFTDYRFPDKVLQLASAGLCNCYTIKMDDQEASVDDVVLHAVYGTSQQPPGSQDSLAMKMRTLVPKTIKDESEEQIEEEEEELDGIWVPPNSKTRALALYMLFPTHTVSHVPPEPEPIPPHIAVAYDAFKRSDVMALIEEYQKDVMRFGFFTDEKPETAKLIAKTVMHFEKKAEETT